MTLSTERGSGLRMNVDIIHSEQSRGPGSPPPFPSLSPTLSALGPQVRGESANHQPSLTPWPACFPAARQPPDSPPEGGGAPASQGVLGRGPGRPPAPALSVSAHASTCPYFVGKVSDCASKSCEKGSPCTPCSVDQARRRGTGPRALALGHCPGRTLCFLRLHLPKAPTARDSRSGRKAHHVRSRPGREFPF